MPEPAGLAFKAYEVEELADLYFFRPLGMVFARAAHALRLTPTTVTVIGAMVGCVGGGLLYDDRLGLVAFALIIVHSILDSSDGQLARMTGQVSDVGRVLDGVSGYLTHAAIYVAVAAGTPAGPWRTSIVPLAIAAAISNIVHAQMYDYHRSSYTRFVIKGVATDAVQAISASHGILHSYETMQRALSGMHHRVEETIAARSIGGVVGQEDRARYREIFYSTVRGWNLMGDNTRFYAIGVLAWLHRLDWFFAFVALPMNAAFVILWLWQARADRRFLAGL